MKLFRKFLFWCHLLAGVSAGIIIFTMSVTGVLLTYEKQIVVWADLRASRIALPSPGTSRLPLQTLLDEVRKARPGLTINSVTMRADASEPAAFGIAGGNFLFVNPYTGLVIGEGNRNVRGFFRGATDLHRWLGAEGDNRATARAITGACNLGFLFLVLSGFYMWWPRKWTKEQFRNVMWFKRGLPGKARDFNWHNVIGFWSVVPLFIIVLSGAVISYSWAGNLVYRVVGETLPAPRVPQAQSNPAIQPRDQEGEISLGGLDILWARAEQQMPGWRSISLRLPTSADAPLIFTIDQGNGGQPQKRATLTLNRNTGEVVRWELFSSYTAGRKLRTFLRFAHTGEVAGITGQTIAGLVSAGGAVLVFTGLALALRRLRGWIREITEQSKITEQTENP
ncbi:MAG: PepSY domain-containing protein [Acidobacteria bacterium]|nr:PepSY domain-containing protein [Acidobacteriota bacterium]